MSRNEAKKEIIAAYKERKTVGGVYRIKNQKNGEFFLDVTANIGGIGNRFDFSQKTKNCFNIKLKKIWTPENSGEFVLEILEELEMGEGQSKKAFQEDLETLKNIWVEKLGSPGI
jgi:hypothetical protein